MLASQISVFVRSYIVETENEVKNEVGNQKVHLSGDVPMSIFVLICILLRMSLSREFHSDVMCRANIVAYLLWLPRHPLSSLVSVVSSPAFRRGRMILSVSPSSTRMFSRSVPCIFTDNRFPDLRSSANVQSNDGCGRMRDFNSA